MTAKEKDELIADLMRMLHSMDSTDPAMAGIKFIRELEAFINKVAEIGRMEGFTEGYKEARRKLEQEYSKLN
jgi:hypothetical protein